MLMGWGGCRIPLPALGRSRRDRARAPREWAARVPAAQQEQARHALALQLQLEPQYPADAFALGVAALVAIAGAPAGPASASICCPTTAADVPECTREPALVRVPAEYLRASAVRAAALHAAVVRLVRARLLGLLVCSAPSTSTSCHLHFRLPTA